MSLQSYLNLPRLPRVTFTVDDGPDVRPARRWETKLGGAPYLPKGAPWPMRDIPARDGNPATQEPFGFIAQINLADLEAWRQREGAPQVLEGHLPTQGILQIYSALEPAFGFNFTSDPFIPVHACLWPEVITDEAALAEPLLAVVDESNYKLAMVPETSVVERYSAGMPKNIDAGGEYFPLAQSRFPFPMTPVRPQPEFQLPGPYTVDIPRQAQIRKIDLTKEQQEQVMAESGEGGIQLGGHAFFTQSDPRDTADLRLLFQLDDTASETVIIGDAGTMGFFLHIDDLAAGRWDRLVMAWNCY